MEEEEIYTTCFITMHIYSLWGYYECLHYCILFKVPNIINMIVYHIFIFPEENYAIQLAPVINTDTSSHMLVFLSL